MLKKLILVTAAAVALAAASAATAADNPVVSTTGINLRAGPGLNYPVVVDLPAGARMALHGCITGYTWCDVSWGGNRGWLASAYMSTIYRNAPVAVTAVAAARLGVAIVAFDAGYWHRYYFRRPWFPRWRYYRW